MTKVIRAQRKTIYRYKKQMENLKQLLNKTENEVLNNKEMEGVVTKEATTPFSKTERFLEEVPNIPTPEKEKVKKAIFENYVLKESLSSQFSKAKSRSERDVLKNVINNDIVKKYKLKTNFGYSCLGLKGRLRKQKRALEIQKIKRIKEIQDFLRRDDNSRTTAGKRETKTFHKDKRQIRYLQSSLEKLHKKYMEEGGLASYTTFTRYKPFYILDPKVTQRNTCACVKHANLTFLAQKLKILGVLETDDLEKLVSAIVCDKLNKKCMYGECQSCGNKTVLFDLTHKNKDVVVFWNAWVTKNHEYMKKNDSQEND
ncbi:hypothetical protein PYW07_006610 [Mythimna separata]|uniref:Uncharacterized protein n=1 Tax=Mythimna separata TaxID=271217 RepID=A0AAD8DXT3_MYTSE|nr:hypothetical protein PYW07_006610 [Mythimna separata]